ncbi:MAG: M81 family metallopeptidase [Caldilineaceae bacterium]
MAVECCTFSPVLTALDDFEILRGDALLLIRFSTIIPARRFRRFFFAQATPGGPVATGTYAESQGGISAGNYRPVARGTASTWTCMARCSWRGDAGRGRRLDGGRTCAAVGLMSALRDEL